MFEPSRVKDAHLSDAYEKLVPVIKKEIQSKEDNKFISNNLFGFLQKG